MRKQVFMRFYLEPRDLVSQKFVFHFEQRALSGNVLLLDDSIWIYSFAVSFGRGLQSIQRMRRQLEESFLSCLRILEDRCWLANLRGSVNQLVHCAISNPKNQVSVC